MRATADKLVEPARQPGGTLETAALLMLLPGSVIVPIVGWLAGVVLLWVSNVWTTRDKLIGTLVVPGGLFGILYLVLGTTGEVCVGDSTGASECFGGPSGFEQVLIWLLAAFLIIGPFASTGYLAWRLKRARAATG